MNTIFKTTLATAFAAACLAGASVSFAANNNGHNGGTGDNAGGNKGGISDSTRSRDHKGSGTDVIPIDPSQTNSITNCDSTAGAVKTDCMNNGQNQN